MDPIVKRKVMIGIIVVCLGLALGITVFTRSGGGSGGSRAGGPLQMLCTNPDCGKAFEMSRRDFREGMTDMEGPGGRMSGVGAMPVFTCRYCGEESARVATKCEKCGKISVTGSVRGDYPDRCPECGYSHIEEKIQRRK